ncbi:MAG TPA: GntG family PLP-dependent aldolase [Patescibacteria group bacterium]|nr:GntG family PLP-dependent aldolase [Patescibacteria group bacterium]
MIDLRSDTVTKPTPEMREAMAQADVGDDVYGEDATINELQEYTAELFGKPAAIFVPSGTMGNQICLAIHTRTGDEVICEAESHIFHYETAGASVISRTQLYCVPSERGSPEPDAIREAIRPHVYYFPKTAAIALENSHNRHGGAVISQEYVLQIEKIARENDIAFHCDGARIWNASVASGVALKEMAEPFDTLSVCFSKGLGAPVGSIIVGKKEHIDAARKWRKILGGGMRQAGILAAGALYALKNQLPTLKSDHEKAREFAVKIAEGEFTEVDLTRVETNIVLFKVHVPVSPELFLQKCRERGLLISSGRVGWFRAVFHHQILKSQVGEAAQIIDEVLQEFAEF